MANITFPAESSTLVLNERTLVDSIEGDFLTLTPVNPKTSRVNGSNGVSIASRSDGQVYDLTVPVQKYGEYDVFLNNALNQADPVVFAGSLKENFQRDGVDFVGTWSLEMGSITTQPTDTRNNQDGNAMVEYTIQFRNAKRSI